MPVYDHSSSSLHAKHQPCSCRLVANWLCTGPSWLPTNPAPVRVLCSFACSFGVICRKKASPYPYNSAKLSGYDGDEDDEPLIKGSPKQLQDVGRGSASIRLLEDSKQVEIDGQRGLEVARIRGSIKTL